VLAPSCGTLKEREVIELIVFVIDDRNANDIGVLIAPR
jgi:hypothetical protein